MTPRHLALVGPTASGKSALALALAQSRPELELVSIDSMQVYRGMDIGTAKPTAAEQAAVPHHLLDVADPEERFAVAHFARLAGDAIAAIEGRGHLAVLVGGTGLYLQAVIGDIDPPGDWPELRATLLRQEPEALRARLQAADPAAAARIEPGNVRRLARALEVTLGSGRPFSSFGPGVGAYPSLERFVLLGVWLPRQVTADRIAKRVEAMTRAGLVEEVRRLAPRLGPTARQALGYKEVLAHLEEGADLHACLQETVRRTRAFSRRQRVWFRRDPRVRWHGTSADPNRLLPGLQVEVDRVLAG